MAFNELMPQDAAQPIIELPPHRTSQHLPQHIKIALKPHYSDWIVLTQVTNVRQYRHDEHTRLLIKTKKGFQQIKRVDGAIAGGNVLIIKNRAAYTQSPSFLTTGSASISPHDSVAGQSFPSTIQQTQPVLENEALMNDYISAKHVGIQQANAASMNQSASTSSDKMSHSVNQTTRQSSSLGKINNGLNALATSIPVNQDESPDDDKRILVTIKGATGSNTSAITNTSTNENLNVSIRMQGDSSLRRSNDGEADKQLLFPRLNEDGSYQLNANILGIPPQPLTPAMPFSDYLSIEKINALNIGEDGGLQLLDHQVTANGNAHLTLLNQPPSFGVFFDGTGNNLTNDNKKLDDEKEPTNVAKLFELYPFDDYRFRYYVEGIGTKANKKDNKLDLAFAFSFDERIMEALKETQRFFKDDKFKYIKVGILDVFGFSRGATAARAFVNQVHEINQHQPDFWGGPKLMVRFIGPFDTVSSTMGDGDNFHNEPMVSKKLPYPVTLHLNETSAGAVYHPVAYDEQRDNFPLSSLKSADGSTPANITEIALPGAHADIGGGYCPADSNMGNGYNPSDNQIDYDTIYIAGVPGDPGHAQALEKIKTELEQKYYWPSIDIHFKQRRSRLNKEGAHKRLSKLDDRAIITPYKPYWPRNHVDNRLSLYALHQMHTQAVKYGVPFKTIETLGTIQQANGMSTYRYELPPYLTQDVESAMAHGVNSQAWQGLYKKFIHHSHKYVGLKNSLAHSRENDAKHTTENNVREIFYNQPNNAVANTDSWQPHFIGDIVLWRK